MYIRETTSEGTKSCIELLIEDLGSDGVTLCNNVLVIDEISLAFALETECRQLFAKLTLPLRSVICCRVSPILKARVVEMAREFFDSVTLAIGKCFLG